MQVHNTGSRCNFSNKLRRNVTLFISVPSWCIVLICRVVQEALLFAPDYNSLLLFRPATDSHLAAVGGCVVFPPCAASAPAPGPQKPICVTEWVPVVLPVKRQIYNLLLLVCRISVCVCVVVQHHWVVIMKKLLSSLIIKQSQTCSSWASVKCQSKFKAGVSSRHPTSNRKRLRLVWNISQPIGLLCGSGGGRYEREKRLPKKHKLKLKT